MADNIPANTRVPSSQISNERRGSNLDPYVRVAIVKDNIDATRTGQLRVLIKEDNNQRNPERDTGWVPCYYTSPYFGYTPAQGPGDNFGTFKQNPTSYGFWAPAPDIGSWILVAFVNGDKDQCYYIASIPKPEIHNMVPAVAPGSKQFIVDEPAQGKSFGGADVLPTSELNLNNRSLKDDPTFWNKTKPINSYHAGIMFEQGVLRDSLRGPITTSSYRETPSRVFGISTPGSPIYRGGFTPKQVAEALASAPNSKFEIEGRVGGHSFVMDDGDIAGNDRLVRLRSAAGHQITMSDDGQILSILHSNGRTYIEMNSEGALDIFSQDSFNVRSAGDINFHADRNINIHAAETLSIHAKNIHAQTEEDIRIRSGRDTLQSSGARTHLRSGETTRIQSGSEMSLKSLSNNIVIKSGNHIRLNDQDPAAITEIEKNEPKKYDDTIKSAEKGWLAAPGKLSSITSRVTTHFPRKTYENGSTGSTGAPDKHISDTSSEQSVPRETAGAIAAAPPSPSSPTSPVAVAANAPIAQAASGKTGETAAATDTKTAAQTAISQNYANNSGLTDAQKQAQGVIAPGIASVRDLAQAGQLKAGAESAAARALAQGMPIDRSITDNLMSGKAGLGTAASVLTSSVNQAAAVQSNILKSANQLAQTGVVGASSSPQQVLGLAMAAAQSGVTAVGNMVSGVAGATGSMLNAVASGTFAAKLTDTLGGTSAAIGASISGIVGSASQAISGIAGSVGGALKSVGGAISGALGQLQTPSVAAFKAVEASIPTLPTGVPIAMGDTPADQKLEGEEAREAQLEELRARLSLVELQIDGNPDEDSLAEQASLVEEIAKLEKPLTSTAGTDMNVGDTIKKSLADAQSSVSQAAQSVAGASQSLSATVAGAAKTGLGALPGGISTTITQIGQGSQSAIGQISAGISALTGTGLGAGVAAAAQSGLGIASALTGSIAGGARSAISQMTGSTGDLAGAAQQAASSLGGGLSTSVASVTAGAQAKLKGLTGSIGNLPSVPGMPVVQIGLPDADKLQAQAAKLMPAGMPLPVEIPGAKIKIPTSSQLMAGQSFTGSISKAELEGANIAYITEQFMEAEAEGDLERMKYLASSKGVTITTNDISEAFAQGIAGLAELRDKNKAQRDELVAKRAEAFDKG